MGSLGTCAVRRRPRGPRGVVSDLLRSRGRRLRAKPRLAAATGEQSSFLPFLCRKQRHSLSPCRRKGLERGSHLTGRFVFKIPEPSHPQQKQLALALVSRGVSHPGASARPPVPVRGIQMRPPACPQGGSLHRRPAGGHCGPRQGAPAPTRPPHRPPGPWGSERRLSSPTRWCPPQPSHSKRGINPGGSAH